MIFVFFESIIWHSYYNQVTINGLYNKSPMLQKNKGSSHFTLFAGLYARFCRKNTKSMQRFYILHFTCDVFLNTNRTNLTNLYSCHPCYSCSYNYDYSLNTNRTNLTNLYSCHSCNSCSKIMICGSQLLEVRTMN